MTKSPRKKTEVQRSSADFDEVLALIEAARRQAGRAVNVQLIDLYWNIGAIISRRIEDDGWGKGTVEQLSMYLARAGRAGFRRRTSGG